MTKTLTPSEQAKLAADLDKRSSDIRALSVSFVAANAVFAKTKEDHDKNQRQAAWIMAADIVALYRDFGDPAHVDYLDAVFEKYGLLGPRNGQRAISSLCTLAFGSPGPKMVQSPRAGQGMVNEWLHNRAGEKFADPTSEICARVDDGEVIPDVAKFIEDYVDEVTGRKNLIGLTDAWKRRCKGDEPEVEVSADEVALGIIDNVATTETLATVDLSDLPAGVVLNTVSEVLAIIGDDGKVRFQLSPRQDLALLSAGLSKPDGSNAALPIRQTMELFASSALLLPVGLSDMPKNEGDDPSIPGIELLPTTRQHLLINGVWTSSLAREATPSLIMKAKPIGAGLPLPSGAFFVNAAQRGRVEKEIMPPEKRELWDKVSQEVSGAGVTSLRFVARENSRVKDQNLGLPPMSEFGQGRREFWAWDVNEKAYKPMATFDVPAYALDGLATSFVTKNANKGAGKHAEVEISPAGLSLALGSASPFVIEGKGTAVAKLSVIGRSLIDTLKVILGVKPEGLAFHVDQGGALEISFSTSANAYRVFLPKAIQTDKVWTANHGDRFKRVTREDFAA